MRLNGVPTVSKNRATVPQKPEGRKQPASRSKEFDPALFATKLEYVEDLGISEEEAKAYGVGENRGKLYVALRDEFYGWICSCRESEVSKTAFEGRTLVKLKRA